MAGDKIQDKYNKRHRRNLNSYGKRIDNIYRDAIRDAVAIGGIVGDLKPDKMFSFDDYPITRKRVDKLLQGLKKSIETAIINGVEAEWTLANNKNSELSNRVFGKNVGKLTKEQYKRYYSNNDDAREAFIQRKENGLNLSDRVWSYTDQFKEEIEMGLDLGIRSGRSADEMSRDIRSYLKHPDKLFRRVRDEYGQLQLSKRAGAYHPGRGVYRSSYKNARRLAATETNMAYRTADYMRWQSLDFVVGIQIEPSKTNHTPDICDDLAGRYPKDFKWTGWHPHCRCHALTILKTEKEMEADTERILNGEEPLRGSVNEVKDVPQVFKDWAADNDERLQNASSVPYFISDNPKYTGVQPHYGAVGAVAGTKLGRTATKAAFKIYENMPAPTLTAEVAANTEAIAKDLGIKGKPKPMTFLEANEGRGNVSWGNGYEFSTNCQSVVAVHEARLRGLPVTALGYDGTKGCVSYKLGERFESIWRNPKTGDIPAPTILRGKDFGEMLAKIEKATNAKGRYHIGINMPENKGHVITAERISKEQILFYDAQNGTFLNIEEYAVSKVEFFEVLKVDKLLLDRSVFKRIARLL